MDRQARRREYRQHRHCSVAHLWNHSFPVARGLPGHACRANDTAVAAAQLLPKESSFGRATQLLINTYTGRSEEGSSL